MTNIIIPVVESPKAFAEFVETKKLTKYKIFVGIKQNLLNEFSVSNKNVEICVYPDTANKEQIINALHDCKLKRGKIMILRRVPTKDEFSMLESSKKDIVSLKAKHNKFVTACKNFVNKIIRKIFAFNFFEDISAICYGENMFQLLSVCQNLSMASRINKYIGVEIEEYETDSKSVKKDYNRTKTAILFSLATLLLLASFAGLVCYFVFAQIKALHVILIIFGLILVSVVWFMSLVNTIRVVAVGDLNYAKAEQIKI